MTYNQETIKPYNEEGDKAQQVEAMFDNIAPTYDALNHRMSWNIDKYWRNKAIDILARQSPKHILDIATGTGDFAILAAEKIKPQTVVGADISEGMMAIARKKTAERNLEKVVRFERQDCTALSYPDNSFDAVTAAFGIRNFQDLEAGLSEMCRVLKTGGKLSIVELTTPVTFPMKQLFWAYSHVAMPLLGRLLSKDRRAYTYLPRTMEAFPQGEVMKGILEKAGFGHVMFKRYTFGLSTMYLACK